MDTSSDVSLSLSGEELTTIAELLDAEQSRLLVEIRHTDHRSFREELRRRLSKIEQLIDRAAPERRLNADYRAG